MSEGRKFPAEYDQWIVKAVGEISSLVWDLSAGALDVSAGDRGPGNLKQIADIVRRHSMGFVEGATAFGNESLFQRPPTGGGGPGVARSVQIVITLS